MYKEKCLYDQCIMGLENDDDNNFLMPYCIRKVQFAVCNMVVRTNCHIDCKSIEVANKRTGSRDGKQSSSPTDTCNTKGIADALPSF